MYIMNKLFFGFIGVILSLSVSAHEMTPTYPEWKISSFEHILETTIEIFNKRKEVEYYELGVFDEKWNPVPFVTSYNVIRIEYLDHVKIGVYIRREDRMRAVYVCSKSKLRKGTEAKTAISSKICSKFKNPKGRMSKVYSELVL